MTVYFQFTSTDPFVTGAYGLTGPEITAVKTWQNTIHDYVFSFHTSHDKGWPVYVTNRKGKNMSKFNLNSSTPTAFVDNGSVSKAEYEDAQAVINANLEVFKKMAKNFYEGIPDNKPTAKKCSCGGAIFKNRCLSCKKVM